jgi:hypothetical protein
VRVLDELPRQLGQLRVALRERGQVREPLANLLGSSLRSPPAREQTQRATVGSVDQVDDLIELSLLETVTPRCRQVLGDVQDRLA